MENNKFASVGRAFIAGGLICVAIQLVMTVLGAVLPPEAPLALRGALSLIICSLVCIPLSVSGVYQKIDAWGGMGAGLPLVGLVSALTGMICGARAEGAPLGKAIAGAFKIMVPMLIAAFVVCVIIAFALTAFGVGIFA